MARSVIDLIFQATDKASGTAKKVGDAVESVGKKADFSASKAFSMGAAFSGGFAAMQGAIALASNAVGFFNDKLSQSAKMQTDAIGNAGGLAVALGKPFNEAVPIIDKLNATIDKTFGKLPGINQLYKDIAGGLIDNLVPAAKTLDGAVDFDLLQKKALDLSRTFGIIGTAQGVDSANIVKTLQRLMMGDESVKNLQLFESGTGARVLEDIKKEATAKGVDKLKDLESDVLLEIITKSGQKYITDEMLQAYQDSFDGALAGMQSTADMYFDFSKKLKGRGGKTVLDAAGQVIGSIMSVFDKVATGLGFSPDSFQNAVYDFFTMLSEVVNTIGDNINMKSIVEYLTFINSFFNEMATSAEEVMSGSLESVVNIGMYAQLLGEDWANAIMNWVESIDWASALINLGRLLIVIGVFAANLVAGFATTINARVSEMYMSAVETIVYGLKEIFTSIGTEIVDGFKNLPNMVSDLINSTIQSKINQGVGLDAPIPKANNNMSAISGYSGSMGTHIGGDNFYITIQTSANPNNVSSFADELVRLLDIKWSQYKGTRFNNSGVGA